MNDSTKRTSFDYISLAASVYNTSIMIIGILVLSYPGLELLINLGIIFSIIILIAFLFHWIRKLYYLFFSSKYLYVNDFVPFFGFAINIMYAYSTLSVGFFLPLLLIIPWIIYNFYILLVFSRTTPDKKQQTKTKFTNLNIFISLICAAGYIFIVLVEYLAS